MTPLVGIILFGSLVVLYLFIISRQRKQPQNTDAVIVYQDIVDLSIPTLFSPKLGLVGRPDRIIEQNGVRIPVEFKTGKTPDYPYHSQIMQVIAYCALVEQHYGAKPPYGVIRYTDSGTEFMINFTPQREQDLAKLLEHMRKQRARAEIHRNHDNARICLACGYRDICNERIDM